MPAKGVTKSGEAYCMNCGASVDSSSGQCPSCLSQLDQEVKAFSCPRCETILEFGTSQCRGCGMRFKVKALKPPSESEDERLLSKLIEWGKPKAVSEADIPAEVSQEAAPEEVVAEPSSSPEHALPIAEVTEPLESLLRSREELLTRMSARVAETKIRLSSEPVSDAASLAEMLGSEVETLSQDAADLRSIEESMSRFAETVTTVASERGMFDVLERSGTAEKVASLGMLGRTSGSGGTDEREAQLAKREEMVDRKIKAYAQKKKQLNDREKEIEAKAERLAGGETPEVDPETARKASQYDELVRATSSLLSTVLELQELPEPSDLPASLEQAGQRFKLLSENFDSSEKRLAERDASEEDMRKLMKALDNLLGKLPSEVIDEFSKSKEFALYEKVLDRLKI